MLRLICALVLCPLFLMAKDTDFTMEADGFALIHTFSFTGGQICRKLDRYHSPDPVAWHIRDEWNSIHLGPRGKASETESEVLSKLPGSCQRGISQSTLIGPLKKGKWQIYGSTSVSARKIVLFSERRVIKKDKETYGFTAELPAVVSLTVQYYSNTTGTCREFVPLILRVESGTTTDALKTIHAAPAVLREARKDQSETCRALPQTIAEGAVEIPPGNYRVSGADVKQVNLYLRK